jgi:predicted bacteriocin transport accessory protein
VGRRRLFFSSILVFAIVFSSCQNKLDFPLYPQHEYSEVSLKIIPYEDSFSKDENSYLIYIFSYSCGHCLEIKNMMIEFVINEKKPTYFIIFNSEIELASDVSSTIGASSIEELSILGVPTLINIEDGKVAFNVAGVKAITEIIEPYFRT